MRDIKIGVFRVHPTILLILFVLALSTFFLIHQDDSEMSQHITNLQRRNAVYDQIELLIENPEFENYLTNSDVKSLSDEDLDKLSLKYGNEAVNKVVLYAILQ